MGAKNLSLPHERRKAKLQSRKLALRVRVAESKEQLRMIGDELNAMKPKPKPAEI